MKAVHMPPPDIAALIANLSTRAADAAIGRSRIVHAPLREALRDRVRRPAGEGGSFLAEPLFEAMFGWKAANRTMQQLADEGLLHPALVAAMAKDQPIASTGREERNTFPRRQAPYHHQLEVLAEAACRASASPGCHQRNRVRQDRMLPSADS